MLHDVARSGRIEARAYHEQRSAPFHSAKRLIESRDLIFIEHDVVQKQAGAYRAPRPMPDLDERIFLPAFFAMHIVDTAVDLDKVRCAGAPVQPVDVHRDDGHAVLLKGDVRGVRRGLVARSFKLKHVPVESVRVGVEYAARKAAAEAFAQLFEGGNAGGGGDARACKGDDVHGWSSFQFFMILLRRCRPVKRRCLARNINNDESYWHYRIDMQKPRIHAVTGFFLACLTGFEPATS